METTTLHILSIDTWRGYDGGWDWNAWYEQETVEIPIRDITPRKIARLLRELGYLSRESRGKVRVDMGEAYIDYHIEVQVKETGEPLYALVEY